MYRIAILALLFPLAAFATHPPKPPVQVDPPDQRQDQQQGQAQDQVQTQSQTQVATASNEGVSQAVSIEDRKQAPSLAQGAQYLVGCGMSVNGGLSNPGDAGFLGFQFITPYCRDQAQIANEAAFGNVRTACEMNRLTPAGQRNLKRLKDAGLEPEPCPGAQPKPDPVPTVVVIEGESCASKQYVGEAVTKGFKECISK